MQKPLPRLVIAGTGSGVGKTSVTLGLIAALRRRGLRVQPFKVGPDFLDPTWHRLAAERQSYNLDTWMTDYEYVQQLFAAKTQDADIAIVEGVMGLFDGASATSLAGSTAQIAALIKAPVLLVATAKGAGRSFAATVKGFAEFDESCSVAGVVANHCGSSRHAEVLREAMQSVNLCPLVGWIQRDALTMLPSRHLGLHSADQSCGEIIERLADSVEASLDLDRLLELANCAEALKTPSKSSETDGKRVADKFRIAVAYDEAFHFYYPDNLELLTSCGAEIVKFSPLHDATLPENISCLYLGGGYPEEFAEQLAENHSMRQAIKDYAEADGRLYAECGGLMYFSQSLQDRDGKTWPMVGVLPFSTRMLTQYKRLGYVQTELSEACLLGPAGMKLRGHEFHYSEIVDEEASDWSRVYRLSNARGSGTRLAGYARGNVLASYVHQHFGSQPANALFQLHLPIAGG